MSCLQTLGCKKLGKTITLLSVKHNMKTLQYSIVYASIRPEIKERVSVGIIFCQEGVIEVRYSTAKLNIVKQLLPKMDYDFLRRSMVFLSKKSTLDSIASIDYLNRYSNNILTVSEIRKVKMDTESLSKDGLYKMYVYSKSA